MQIADYIKLHRKQLLLGLIGLTVAVVGFKLIMLYFFMAPVTITVNKEAKIQLFEVPPNSANRLIKEVKAGDRLSLRLSKGVYRAEISKDEESASVSLSVTSNKAISRDVKLSPMLGLLQFSDRSFTSVDSLQIAADGSIHYLETTTGRLYRYSVSSESAEEIKIVNEPIEAVVWVDENNYSFITKPGIETDYEYTPYVGVVKDGKLLHKANLNNASEDSILALTRSADATAYSVNNIAYLIDGDGKSKKLYEHDKNIDSLSIGGTLVAVGEVQPVNGDDSDEEFREIKDLSTKVILVNTSNREITELEEGSSQPSISPDGKLIAYLSPYAGHIAKTDSFDPVGTFPRGQILTWSKQGLLFSDESKILNFDSTTGISNTLASSKDLLTTKRGYIIKDRPFVLSKYLYVLGSANMDENTRKLVLMTPRDTINYQIRTLFDLNGKPIVVITTNAVLNRDSQLAQYVSGTQRYRLEALQYLTSNGIDTNSLSIQYKPE